MHPSATTGLSAMESANALHWSKSVDLAMAVCVAVYSLFALVVGSLHDQFGLALMVVVPLLSIGLGAYFMAAGQSFNQVLYPALLMALVALHIQVGVGRVEYHFGVFLTLGVLLAYRHWLPIVVGAGLIAVHHVAFDAMQQMGFPVYCMTQPGVATVFLHAGYVVAQSAVEVMLAIAMHKAALEADELRDLVASLNSNGRINLAAAHAPVSTDAGQMLRNALAQLANALQSVQRATHQISQTSDDIAHGAGELNQRTDQSAQNVQQSTKLLSQLNSSVTTSHTEARQAFQLAANASGIADHGSKVMGEMVGTMSEISSSSKKIAEIIGVIDSIAFQTNMLALNAAVEAARAGEHGKGFAVVAAEVGTLAQRSAQAAREIKTLISSSVDRMEQGVKLAHNAGNAMQEVTEAVKRVDEVIRNIEVNSRSQAEGIRQINHAIGQLDAATKHNIDLAAKSTSASHSLQQQTAGLSNSVNCFELAGSASAPAVAAWSKHHADESSENWMRAAS